MLAHFPLPPDPATRHWRDETGETSTSGTETNNRRRPLLWSSTDRPDRIYRSEERPPACRHRHGPVAMPMRRSPPGCERGAWPARIARCVLTVASVTCSASVIFSLVRLCAARRTISSFQVGERVPPGCFVPIRVGRRTRHQVFSGRTVTEEELSESPTAADQIAAMIWSGPKSFSNKAHASLRSRCGCCRRCERPHCNVEVATTANRCDRRDLAYWPPSGVIIPDRRTPAAS
jgi:hypothetical protein